jgi:hypothetical protein
MGQRWGYLPDLMLKKGVNLEERIVLNPALFEIAGL